VHYQSLMLVSFFRRRIAWCVGGERSHFAKGNERIRSPECGDQKRGSGSVQAAFRFMQADEVKLTALAAGR
jgi:hypothetical protein